MRIQLEVDLKNGEPAQTLYTNLYVVTQWEEICNRKLSDGRGLGMSDMACWAWIILHESGAKVPASWKTWVKNNPEMTIISVQDETNPNHTGGELTENN